MEIMLMHHDYDEQHLRKVIRQMIRFGRPAIHAVDVGEGRYVALEGCHRIRAAKALGLTPRIIPVEYSDTPLADLGLDQGDCGMTVAEICDSYYSAAYVIFDDDLEDTDDAMYAMDARVEERMQIWAAAHDYRMRNL